MNTLKMRMAALVLAAELSCTGNKPKLELGKLVSIDDMNNGPHGGHTK